MFASHLPKIEAALQNGTLVELKEERVGVLGGWRCSILAFLPEDGPPMSWSTAKRNVALKPFASPVSRHTPSGSNRAA